LLVRDERVLFPAPADAVVYRRDAAYVVTALRPYSPRPGEGCDLPDGLRPLRVTEDIKPEPGYVYWPAETVFAWLASPTGDRVPVPERIAGPEIDERVHVALDDARGTSLEGHLFTTEGLTFGSVDRSQGFGCIEWSLLARIRGQEARDLHGLQPFGGEGRLAYVESAEPGRWPQVSAEIVERLWGAGRVRMALATPARFTLGWRPGWLDAAFLGTPPGVPGIRLRLVAAAVPRKIGVSGWDYEQKQPKAARWLVPAGAVYFFEVVEGDPVMLVRSAWLESVCDEEQDRRDGYGLVLWGIWAPEGGER
jgi:CRISPR-associated protein Cmr3